MVVLRVAVGAGGIAVALYAVGSAIKTVVLPRGVSSWLTRALFRSLRTLVFDPLAAPKRPFEYRDRVLALYAPVGLLLLPVVWVVLVIIGAAGLFWATGIEPFTRAVITSGSSLLTLGIERPEHFGHVLVAFAEAIIGLGLISLMISYLPTIYGAFSRREALVGMLEVRGGLPPSPVELLTRYARIGWLDQIDEELFPRWEAWFVELEESHTSQPSLVFFRSPHPQRHWVTAAGCVLDTAAIVSSVVDRPRDARADVLLRTGFLALRRIADFFAMPYDPDPAPDDPISVTRREFDLVCVELTAAGIPLKRDRDQAWADYAGWRVNYDAVLVGLCNLVVAPPAKWSSDRGGVRHDVKLKRNSMMRR